MNLHFVKPIKAGDRVIFDKNQVEVFKSETNLNNKEIQQYRQMVLGGIELVGVVKEPGDPLTNVSYPDGWELPVPTKISHCTAGCIMKMNIPA